MRFGEPVKYCTHCRNYKPFMAHHCRTCARCVRLMDHHCSTRPRVGARACAEVLNAYSGARAHCVLQRARGWMRTHVSLHAACRPACALPLRSYSRSPVWVNNCVGEQTQKSFLLFLFYVGVTAGYLLLVVGMRFSVCIVDGSVACGAHRSVADYVMGILLLFMVVLFGTFVCVMGYDQLYSLLNEDSYIDRLQREQAALAERAAAKSESEAGGAGLVTARDSRARAAHDDNEPRPKRSWLHKLERAFGPPVPSYWWWLVPTDPGIRHSPWFADGGAL